MSHQVITGDSLQVLKTLESESVQCCVTSPPYWGLRDYGIDGQLGLEKTPELYVARMVEVFGEVRRVLRSDGTLWLNLGDSYAGSGCGWRGDDDAPRYASRPFQDQAATKAFSRSKRIERGTGRWGGGNSPAVNCKPKDLCGIPWMVAFALRSDGWYLRQDIIWSKPNPMPESVTDRCTKAHEYIFLMSKSARYFYDAAAIAEPLAFSSIGRLAQDVESQEGSPIPFKTNGNMKAAAPRSYRGSTFTNGKTAHGKENVGQGQRTEADLRNKRSVWEVSTKPYAEAHFATFPPDLIEPCIKAGSKEGDTVLDPFSGAGTTGLVCSRFQRKFIGIELNPAYAEMSRNRIQQDAPMFNEVTIRAAGESQGVDAG